MLLILAGTLDGKWVVSLQRVEEGPLGRKPPHPALTLPAKPACDLLGLRGTLGGLARAHESRGHPCAGKTAGECVWTSAQPG